VAKRPGAAPAPTSANQIAAGTVVVVDGVECQVTCYINGQPFVRYKEHAGKFCCPHPHPHVK
jgi:hypothetical protein